MRTIIAGGAVLSPDREYRYALWRRWEEPAPYALFIGLNPSTADENDDDPTIRRCMQFAFDWGFGAVYMANLFAWRATKREDMLKHSEPVGSNNNAWLSGLAHDAGLIVCAWGADGRHMQRDSAVIKILSEYKLVCLGTNQNGTPGHPLYLKADTPLEEYLNKRKR